MHGLGQIWQTASSWKGYCQLLAISAAILGNEPCLRVLHGLGGDAAASLAAANAGGMTLAHVAAGDEHEGCLRVLHELGGEAAASLAAADAGGWTPAHSAATYGHEGCLRVLHELGGEVAASLVAVDARGDTPSHLAAHRGHEGCLRVLHELGGEVAASLAAVAANGWTPAHFAANAGREGCLRVLHELLCLMIDQQLMAMLAESFASTARDELVEELRAGRSLAWTQGTKPFDHVDPTDSQLSPASLAAENGHADCFRFLAEIGGASGFLEYLARGDTFSIDDYPCLLTDPTLLDLGTKRGWLNAQLSRKVQEAGSEAAIELIVYRDDMLQGLCDTLGVHEVTGQVNAQAGSLSVTFDGEAAEGDGVRREWFGQTTKEMIDPNRGLFRSLDGGRTLQPNPESGDHAADHLAHFALLGRIAGMALHHRELLDVPLSEAFLKAVLGYPIAVDDVASVDPEKCDNLRKMRAYTAEVLQAIDLTFALDTEMGQQDFIIVDASKREQASIELKPGGANIEVTPDHLEEYLQLYAEHHLIGAIREQVNAVRQGLGVFMNEALMTKLRACCSVAEFQLMLCGAPEIDVDDWQASAEYRGGYSAGSDQVKWFWAEVRAMTPEERGQLLFFCTGSARAPATGFANLMGYSGQQQRFTIECDDRGIERPPTAATCFNTLKLPPYASAQTLAAKVRLIFWAEGFHEGAVAA